MEKIIFTIVRHRGGGFHLGVQEENQGTARFLSNVQVVIRSFNGLPEQRCDSARCLYRYKSIYSGPIHAWLEDKRNNDETTIPLITATLEQTENEDIYTIRDIAPLKKVSRHPIYVNQDGERIHYSKMDVFRVLFCDLNDE